MSAASKPIDLSEQVALITGSSRGIGRAVALEMARCGAKVVVSSRKREACEKVVAEIAAAGGTAIAVACNASDPAQLEELAKEALNAFGYVSTLVCNAAVNPAYGSLATLEDRQFDKIMGTNVSANLKLINLVTPSMAERGGGSVVIISSIVAFFGSKMIGAYAMSKAANIQMARNYAVELGPKNIRVNVVAPGLIKTDFSTPLWDSPGGAEFITRTPLGRVGQSEDIAPVVAFFASDMARFITGQSLLVDGGVSVSDPF